MRRLKRSKQIKPQNPRSFKTISREFKRRSSARCAQNWTQRGCEELKYKLIS